MKSIETMKHKPYLKFKGYLREKQLTYSDLAELLAVRTSTISQKINGQSDFYLSEVCVICNKFGIDCSFFLN